LISSSISIRVVYDRKLSSLISSSSSIRVIYDW